MNSESKDIPDVIAFPPLIFATNALVSAAAHWLCPIRLFAPVPALLGGAALLLVSAALALWARSAMVRVGTNIRPDKPALALTGAGPYGFTRNPMYLSLCLMQLGIGLLIDGVLPVLFVLPLALLLHFGVIKREERYLAARFGDTYINYQQRVRRWI